jgi:hypothetical protein
MVDLDAIPGFKDVGKPIAKPMQSTERNIHSKERRERKAANSIRTRIIYSTDYVTVSHSFQKVLPGHNKAPHHT